MYMYYIERSVKSVLQEEEDEEHDKNEESTFWDIPHVLHNWSTNICILVIFHTFFTLISLKVQIESENEQNPYYMVFNGDRP